MANKCWRGVYVFRNWDASKFFPDCSFDNPTHTLSGSQAPNQTRLDGEDSVNPSQIRDESLSPRLFYFCLSHF